MCYFVSDNMADRHDCTSVSRLSDLTLRIDLSRQFIKFNVLGQQVQNNTYRLLQRIHKHPYDLGVEMKLCRREGISCTYDFFVSTSQSGYEEQTTPLQCA